MLLKARSESDELLAWRCLNTRMELAGKDKGYYLNLEKGYEGERYFDQLAVDIEEERYIINDLLLEVNNSHFQIDSLIISQGVIYLLDIKNYRGDCYLESDKLYAMNSGREFKNPIDQLKRSGTLFRQLLQNLKLNFLVETFVIFIHPEFTLYQAPMNQPMILPTQLYRFFCDLNNTPSKLNDEHKKLAQTLLSLHQVKNPFTSLPNYEYEGLQKGIYCRFCRSFFVTLVHHNYICRHCKDHEEVEQAILRNVKEFRLLFPDRKITTQSISEWCKTDLNKRTICRILKKNLKAFGKNRGTYYQ